MIPGLEIVIHRLPGRAGVEALKVLITGATGFIGSELSRALSEEHETSALVRKDSFEKTKLPDKLRKVEGDLLDSDLKKKVEYVAPDAVVHLASLTPVRFSFAQSLEYAKVNYLGTVNLIESLRGLPLKQFVHASSMEAYKAKQGTINEEDPLEGGTPYGVSKAAADLYVQVAGKAWNLPYTILRPGNTFGRPFTLPDEARGYLVEKAVIGMLTGNKIEFDGFPDRVRSWLYYPDHVSAYKSVLGNVKATQRIYNAVAEPHSIGDIVNMVAGLTEFKGEIEWGKNPRPYDPEMLMTTAERIKFETGWRPVFSIAEGLARTVEYWKKKLN